MKDEIKAFGLAEVLREKIGDRDRVNPQTLLEVAMEYTRAIQLHGHFQSTHEAYAVMLEELDEFWEEVKQKKPNFDNMCTEAIQLAAMCLKFVDDYRYKANE